MVKHRFRPQRVERRRFGGRAGLVLGVTLALIGGIAVPGAFDGATPAAAEPETDESGQSGQQSGEVDTEWEVTPADPEQPGDGSNSESDGGDDSGASSGSIQGEDPAQGNAQQNSEAEAPSAAPGIAPLSIPDPTSTTAVISVKVGGDRLPDGTVAPLEGVRLSLYTGGGATPATAAGDNYYMAVNPQGSIGTVAPAAWTWAHCTSDADGDCNFVVPIRAGAVSATGAPAGTRFWVSQTGASPTGWYSNPTIGFYYNLLNGTPTSTSWQYRFRAPAVQVGNTYRSTDPMPANNETPDTHFMRFAPKYYALGAYPAGLNNGTARAGRTTGMWNQSRLNPSTENAVCPTNIALIADTSGSLQASGMTQLKNTMSAFVDSLQGTNARLALFSFSTNSPGVSASNHPTLMPVATAAQATAFKNQWNGWVQNGNTNWDEALSTVANATTQYDLAILLTDGGATVNSISNQGATYMTFQDVDGGIFSANQLKAKGTRILGLGVGAEFAGDSKLNLRAVTGPTEGVDYVAAANFAEVTDFLQDLVARTCTGSIGVQKMIVPAGGTVADATPAPAGWEFSASGASGVTVPAPATQTTTAGGNGKVDFGLTYGAASTTGVVTVADTQQAGYEVLPVSGKNAVCTNVNTGAAVTVTNAGTAENPAFTVNATENQRVECVMYNREDPPEPTMCEANTIFTVGWDTGAIQRVVLAGGSAASVGTPALVADLGPNRAYGYNSLALSLDGSTLWASDQTTSSSNTNGSIYRIDVATGTVTTYANAWGSVNTFGMIGGAVNPENGYYYTFDTSGDLYAFRTSGANAGSLIGKVGHINPSAQGMNNTNISDIAFDLSGVMYFTANTTSAHNSKHSLYRTTSPVSGAMPTQNYGVQFVQQTVLANNMQIGSLAFGSNGHLYLGTTGQTADTRPQVQELNPATGALVTSSGPTAIPIGGSPVDFASCSMPSTLTVQKDIVERADEGDQFTLSIGGGDLAAASTNTTAGSAVGLQPQTAGAVVTAGQTYTVSETLNRANLAGYYSTTYECVDSSGQEVASGSGTSFTFTHPQPIGGVAEAITCTFTNTPKTLGSVAWQKVQKHGSGASAEYTHLGDSEWNLVGPAGAGSATVAVVDCVAATAAGCASSVDKDHRKGYFQATGLVWGDYQLIETMAPAGFMLDATPRPFTVGEPNGAGTVKLEWDLGQIENQMVSIPSLPLTGGLGEQMFLIVAGLLVFVAAAGGAVYRRRQARVLALE